MLPALYIFLNALLIVIAIPMIQRKVKPNWFYGVRLPRTINNPGLWYEINAYGGKCLLIAGVVGLLVSVGAAFLDLDNANYVAIAGSGIGVALTVAAIAIMWRLTRLDNEGNFKW
jgi:uncharacterized membrane protein